MNASVYERREALAPRGGGAGKPEQPRSPSPAARCRACGPQSCRLHTFSGTLTSAVGNRRSLGHRLTLARVPPCACPGTAVLGERCGAPAPASGPSPVPLAIGGRPPQGGSGESLVPTFPWAGRPTGLETRLHHQGAACHSPLTHQHLGHAVLLSDVAEVPGHVGLEPDVLPIRRRLLEGGRARSAYACCAPPTVPLPRQTCSSPHNLLHCIQLSPLLASRLGSNEATPGGPPWPRSCPQDLRPP